jgi:DNA-binding XRE family transcriptional regulator
MSVFVNSGKIIYINIYLDSILPVSPIQLKKLRKKLGLSQQEAADIVLSPKRSWQNWETDLGKTNHRAIPEPILELFCKKANLSYKIVDKKVLIEL